MGLGMMTGVDGIGERCEGPAVALEEELGDEVEVGHQGGLQDDGHVAGVEELDGVGLLHAAPALAAHRQVHAEPLGKRGNKRQNE